MMTASVFLGGSLFVLLIVNLYSFPLEKGSNPSTPYSRSNTNTAANVASNQGGPSASLSPGLVPYSPQYRGVLVPIQHPGLSQYAVQSDPTGYVTAGVSQPAQAGGYTAGSVQTGVPVQPAAGSNFGASSSTSNTNAAANVALSQGGPSAYSSVAVPYNTQYGGVPLQQPGLSQYAVQGLPATYASSSLSAPAQAGGSTASSTQTGGAVQPQSEINWAVPPPKLGEETSPSAQGLASSTGDSLGPVLPPLPAYQPGELSHFEKAAEAGDYQSETEELGRRTVPATMEAAAAAVAAAGGLASPVFSAQQFGMGGFWGNPYPYFDFMFLTGQYPVGTVSHFSQNYEQGRDYAHSTHYLKDQPFYPSFDQQIVTIPGGQSLQNPSLYTSPVLRGYYQGSTQTPITGVLRTSD
ncbi:uncharacterized protein LOC115787453 [Archocentrus centrarchus]|uniref:uncharacterized protein LOC115787453 n=1 Tax=Archocentrus centrarchus TaxID=63155 RepID=UPI0011EA2072|nr:uncharacterized protein LOC115787453 [Archocentrus centrarchus]